MRIRVARGAVAWCLRKAGRWGVCLPPRAIYVLPEHEYNYELLRHEMVHWRQFQELGTVRFYTKYIWLLARHGYKNHPMEKEARAE